MPMYEYQCASCTKICDRVVAMASRDDQRCDCGAQLLRVEIPSSQVNVADKRYAFGAILSDGSRVRGALNGSLKNKKGFG